MALAVSSCAKAEDLSSAATVLTLPLDTPHTADAATASARLAWGVMTVREDIRTRNAALSPSSLAVTLAMLAEGATGDSLESLDEAFGLSGDDRSAAVGALRQSLAGYEDLPKKVDAKNPPETPVVHQANRTVILNDTQINPGFLDRLATYYGSGATRVPFSEAGANLDAWAKKHTAGLIKKTGIALDPQIKLITQDALLFAAQWRKPFSSEDTPLSFTSGDGATSEIEALSDSFTAPYAKDERWEAVRLAYDDALAMDVVLPPPGTHPSELNPADLEESATALGQSERQSLNLTMPPSNITAKWKLLEPLASLGINFDQMDRIFGGASVLQMVQQTRLIVTAEGTVGAALTESAVGLGATPGGPVEMVVDRPFLMRVLDTRTGWSLFLAIVNDPSEEQD